MTKVQIAAKSLLTGLLVYAGISLLKPLSQLPYYDTDPDTPLTISLLVLCVGLVVAAGLYIVVVSGRLLPEATVDEEPLAADAERRLLAQTLTLTMVAVGLMLLPGSVGTMVDILKLPFVLRPIITEALVERAFPQMLRFSGARGLRQLYDLVRMLLALYLLCGAPQFVRWQLARARSQVSLGREEDERVDHE